MLLPLTVRTAAAWLQAEEEKTLEQMEERFGETIVIQIGPMAEEEPIRAEEEVEVVIPLPTQTETPHSRGNCGSHPGLDRAPGHAGACLSAGKRTTMMTMTGMTTGRMTTTTGRMMVRRRTMIKKKFFPTPFFSKTDPYSSGIKQKRKASEKERRQKL